MTKKKQTVAEADKMMEDFFRDPEAYTRKHSRGPGRPVKKDYTTWDEVLRDREEMEEKERKALKLKASKEREESIANDLINTTDSQQEIGLRYGVTQAMVSKIQKAWGITRDKERDKERDASIIKQLTETNATQQDIAEAHGVSRQDVSKLQRTNGIVREVKKGGRPSWEQVEKTEKTEYNEDRTERTTTIIIKEALL